MDALAPFRIPVTSLKADEAEFQWKLGPDFLKIFNEDQDTENGRFEVNMNLQTTSGVITLDFQVEGIVETLCDRCLVKIEMPVSGQYEIIVKFGDPAETTDEVIFIEPEAHELNVGSLVYDFILLSIPISRRIPDCENLPDPPCDMTVLAYLSQNNNETKTSDGDDDPLWGDLKKVIDN